MARAPSFSHRLELLHKRHDREGFSCGVESLDRYLKQQASQDVRRKANAVFVLVEAGAPTRILGYFSLCATSLEQGAVPEKLRKLIPRYPLVAATLISRLAIAKDYQRQGLGGTLLARGALVKAYEGTSIVGSSMIVVDALDEQAARFYEKHGFQRLTDTMRLILPMATAMDLIETD